jgi:hypothetical protein
MKSIANIIVLAFGSVQLAAAAGVLVKRDTAILGYGQSDTRTTFFGSGRPGSL